MVIFIIVMYLLIVIASIVLPFILNDKQILTSSDILLYWGSFITFIGTTSLGLLTVYLNKKKEAAEKEAYLLSCKPRIDVTIEEGTHIRDNFSSFAIRFTNVSDNIAIKLGIENYIFYNENNEIIQKEKKYKLLTQGLSQMTSLKHKIENISKFSSNCYLELKFSYCDKFDNKEIRVITIKNINGELKGVDRI